jgi:hypothetical protein
MSLITGFSQLVIADANNSSTANLSSGATFTGTQTSTLGVAGIQVSLKTDQNCTDTFNYYASINNFGVTVQAVNSYVRVRVKNEGTATTTEFRLQTALCPIVEAVPRALDDNGYFKTAVKSTEDAYGFEVENTPMGEMRVVSPTRLVGAQFDGTTIDPNFWTVTTLNSATATQGSATIVLTSGTNATAAVQVNSVRRARYVSGTSMRYRSVIQLDDTGTASNMRKWGVVYGATMPTFTDGAYFHMNGTQFQVVTMRDSTPTAVSTGSFNGVLGATYTPTTDAITYEIYWTNSKVWFVVGGDVLHTVSAAATTWASSMNHFIYMSNVNAGNTTSVVLRSRVASIARLGDLLTQPASFFQSGTVAAKVLKYGPGNLHSLILSSAVNGSVVTLWDNTAASGSQIFVATLTLGAQANNLPMALDFKGLPFFNGLTLTIATQNSNATVIYE